MLLRSLAQREESLVPAPAPDDQRKRYVSLTPDAVAVRLRTPAGTRIRIRAAPLLRLTDAAPRQVRVLTRRVTGMLPEPVP
jgi:hypothetical protein